MRKALDPETYQRRDIKRRLSAIEAYQQRIDAQLLRIHGRLNRRLTQLESYGFKFQEE